MAENEIKEEQEEINSITISPTLSTASFFEGSGRSTVNPWSAKDIDRLEVTGVASERDYRKVVDACRFFYRRDPIASSVINKMIEIGIPGIRISQGKLSDNQYRAFEFIKKDIEDFIENCALEYLVSGLLITEIEYVPVTKRVLESAGVKKYTSLKLPQNMWIEDPNTIVIKSPPIGSRDSYFVEIPHDILLFLRSGGEYPDGDSDPELFNELAKLYPEFIRAAMEGKDKILIEKKDVLNRIIKRRTLTDSPYPTPYLYPALELLKHKRNMRRMDYSLASRATGAIQQFKVGNDDFPLLENQEEQLNELKDKITWRDTGRTDNLERIFRLFTNHTVEIQWIYPPTDLFQNDQRYEEINADILHALGFPRILITGEVQRSGTSNADMAILSPIKSIEHIRRKLIRIVREVVYEISTRNNFPDVPNVDFLPLNLVGFEVFIEGLRALYDTGNLSREDFSEVLGYDWNDQMAKRAREQDLMEELDLSEFAANPHSRDPIEGGNAPESDENDE